MKPSATFLLVLVCACSHAQVKQFEIKAGLGYGSRAFINDGGVPFDFIPILSSRYNTGPIMIEGVYRNGRVRIGIAAMYEQNGERGRDISFTGSGDSFYTKTNTITVLAGGYYSFIQHKRISFYTGASAGPSFNSFYRFRDYENDINGSTVNLGYQVTAVGFEYHNIIGFFVEAGYGYKGIICGGLQFNIRQR